MDEAVRHADVIIVGGGIIGCATAYNLARQGVKVLVLEKKEIGNGGSSRNAGGVRQSARDTRELPLAMYAVEKLWPGLSEELGVNVEYHQGGNLRLGKTPAHIDILTKLVKKSTDVGLDVRMISGDDAREICPYMSEEVLGASWCPTDGHANPLQTIFGFYRRALDLGVTFITGVHVAALKKLRGRVCQVVTDDGVYEGGHILLCAGYESRAIARTVEIDLPVEREFSEVFVTEMQPHMFDVMLGTAEADFYGHQSEHGSFVLGGMCGVEKYMSNNDRFVTRSVSVPCLSRGVIKYFPILQDVKVIRTWAGWYDVAIDGVPVIDNCGETPGLTLAFGFCGHGFGIAPAVGIAASELILEGKSETIDVSGLRYNRFKTKA